MSTYMITYKVAGSTNKTDFVYMDGETMMGAVKSFTEWEQNTNGFKWNYTEHAIEEIRKVA